MPHRRVSIARMMAVVAIVALDCGLVRLFLWTGEGLFGLMAIGLGMSLGLIGVLMARGRLRRFSAGFVMMGLAVAIVFVATMLLVPGADVVYLGYLNGVFRRLSRAVPTAMPAQPYTSEGRIALPLMVLIEVTLGLPLLFVSLIGGLLTLAIRRRTRNAVVDETLATPLSS